MCRVRVQQWQIDGGLRADYTVTRVVQHIPGSRDATGLSRREFLETSLDRGLSHLRPTRLSKGPRLGAAA